MATSGSEARDNREAAEDALLTMQERECGGVFSCVYGSIDDVAISSNGRVAVASSVFEGNQWGGAIQVLEARDAVSKSEGGAVDQLIFAGVSDELTTKSGVSGVCWVGDGDNRLAFAGDDGCIRVAQCGPSESSANNANSSTDNEASTAATGPVPEATPPPLPPPSEGAAPLPLDRFSCSAHDAIITSLACSPLRRNVVVSGGLDFSVQVWDVTRDPAAGGGVCVDSFACSLCCCHPFVVLSVEIHEWLSRAETTACACRRHDVACVVLAIIVCRLVWGCMRTLRA